MYSEQITSQIIRHVIPILSTFFLIFQIFCTEMKSKNYIFCCLGMILCLKEDDSINYHKYKKLYFMTRFLCTYLNSIQPDYSMSLFVLQVPATALVIFNANVCKSYGTIEQISCKKSFRRKTFPLSLFRFKVFFHEPDCLSSFILYERKVITKETLQV